MLNESNSWQHQLATAISDLDHLCQVLELEKSQLGPMAENAQRQFSLRVPQAFVDRIEKGNPNDPLLLQVLPQSIEMQPSPGYELDPLQESKASPVSGVLHKYESRALLTMTGACAVNCRYCFRRHYPYSERVPGISQWNAALDYVRSDLAINEVILSGGEPLLLKDEVLSTFIDKLEAIPHLNTLRIHTRMPIVIPDRLTDALVTRLTTSRLKVVMVLHSNHARELDDNVAQALSSLKAICLLNQSVLLKGVNDSAKVLIDLSWRLHEIGVLPYYLHVLDPVEGAMHFDLPEEEAKSLMMKITEKLPGYLVPRLVREVPGMKSKQWVA